MEARTGRLVSACIARLPTVMPMLPDIGQIVLYTLTEAQAEALARRRRESGNLNYGFGMIPGDAVPMLVVARASGYDDGLCAVAGRLLLDDEDDDWWVTSLAEGVAPGAWRPF
jgi:hypothetical protein